MGTPTTLDIPTPRGPARARVSRPEGATLALIMGHGAGGGVDAPDLAAVAAAAAGAGLATALVEQPYRVAGRRAPEAARHLDTAWQAVWEHLAAGPLGGMALVAGGRSSGARVACRTAAATGAVGVACLAFPVRPPARAGAAPKPDRLDELDAVAVPLLVVQGERDPFGTVPDAPGRTVLSLPGDHSLRRSAGDAGAGVVSWARALTAPAAAAP
ncbi:MAG: hypothetical protein RIB67_06425 [Miltoncostaeaceae bacterium]